MSDGTDCTDGRGGGESVRKVNRRKGSVHMIVGPMFSGKTSELIRKITRYQHAGKRCVVIKYAEDVRYDAQRVCTHNMLKHEALCALNLADVVSTVDAAHYDVIGIDEAQFFHQEDLTQFVMAMANQGCTVIVAGLDAAYDMSPFMSMCMLMPLSESVTKLTAVCARCGRDASFTKRMVDSAELKLIGGSSMYKPVCRNCYYRVSKRGERDGECERACGCECECECGCERPK